jgi:hypothetical protein
MARERFLTCRPQAATREVIEQANRIIAEYRRQGFVLTSRQLFYQFVARAWLPSSQSQYKRLYRIIGDARDGGLIDWNAIEDRTREVQFHSSWDGPEHLLGATARRYRTDRWAGQRYRPEVWIEKEALLGVIEDVCTEYRVPYYATHGNDSKTMLYRAGKRFARILRQGHIPLVLQFADHDPTGTHMTRDIKKRLKLYTRAEIEVRRLALTMDQVEQHNPPPNWVKEKDSRTAAYVEEFDTEECWELDALKPQVITELIRDELDELIDEEAWEEAENEESQGQEQLEDVAENWALVQNCLQQARPRVRR